MNSDNSCEHDSCVLLVEDNEELRRLYRLVMNSRGYTVTEASNGREALKILMAGDKPNLIFLDLMMPVMDGWQFLREKDKHRDLAEIPVVVCSAAKNQIPNGVPFLRKPVNLDSILDVAEEYCA